MSDGTAVGCGCDWCGCRNFLALIEGVTYTHVVAIGMRHTVLLTCDGNAVAFGRSQWGQCSIPDLPRGVTYVHRGARMVLTLFFCESHATFCFLSGTEVCRVEMDDSDRLINIRRGFQNKMKTDHGEFRLYCRWESFSMQFVRTALQPPLTLCVIPSNRWCGRQYSLRLMFMVTVLTG